MQMSWEKGSAVRAGPFVEETTVFAWQHVDNLPFHRFGRSHVVHADARSEKAAGCSRARERCAREASVPSARASMLLFSAEVVFTSCSPMRVGTETNRSGRCNEWHVDFQQVSSSN